MNKEKLIESIKKHEGLRLKPYLCPLNKLTIGYGRNLEDNGISKIEANQLLVNDISKIEVRLYNSFSKIFNIRLFGLPDHVQNVLIEMAYQMGVDGLLNFKKTLDFVKKGDYEKASIEMLNSNWAHQTPDRAKELSNLMKGGF